MTTAESRLRAAARALAQAIPDGSAPQLRLPAPGRHRRRAGGRAGPVRWPLGMPFRVSRARWPLTGFPGHPPQAWLVPLAAVAAVTAMTVGPRIFVLGPAGAGSALQAVLGAGSQPVLILRGPAQHWPSPAQQHHPSPARQHGTSPGKEHHTSPAKHHHQRVRSPHLDTPTLAPA